MKKGLMIGALSLALLAAAVAGVAGGHAMHAETQLVAVQTAVLRQGSSGGEVKEVQRRLKNWGYYSGAVDGIFGEGTRKAVISFQQKNGLTADGIVGKATYKALGMNDSYNALAGTSQRRRAASTGTPRPTSISWQKRSMPRAEGRATRGRSPSAQSL